MFFNFKRMASVVRTLFFIATLIGSIALVAGATGHAHAAAAGSSAPSAGSSASSDQQSDSQIQTLIDAIKNDKTRAKLIDALEKANAAKPATAAAVAGAAQTEGVVSFGRQIAESTQAIAERGALSAKQFFNRLTMAPQRLSALGPDQMNVFLTAAREVALAVVITYAIFFALRLLAIRLYQRIGVYAADSGFLRSAFLVIVSALIDAAVVLIAWAAGYLITLTIFGQYGSIGIRQSLYLNAFVLVELFRVLLRIVLSPSTGDLRLINISDRAANLLNSRFTWIAVILGYGQLFVAPIFNQSVSYAAGQAISIVLALIALGIAVVLTVRHRDEVRAWLLGETTDQRSPSRFALFFARYWYWAVLIYFAFLFVVVISQPAARLLPILGATGEVIIALIIGLGITGWIGRASRRGIHLPESMRQKLPLLESRLNAFVPRMLTAVRFLVVIGLLAFVLNVIGIIDVGGWVDTPTGGRVTAAIVSVIVILLVAFLIWLAMSSWVDYRLNPDFGSVPTVREQTLLTLMRNAATIALIVIALMFALSEVGVNIAPLIASAGVFGLAIGFGAQKLVQDIITGIFIQLENAINVGDVVTTAGITGTAERLTIRSVSVRDSDGTYHIIPFSSVDQVSNFMKGFAYAQCNMGVAYRENYEEVKTAMLDAFELLRVDEENGVGIIGDLAWDGITEFGASAVTFRARIKTAAGKQWGIGRAYNYYVKKVFDERNIELAFPTQTVYFGEDKRGNAPAAHLRVAQDEELQLELAPAKGAGVPGKLGGEPESTKEDGEDENEN